MKYTASNNKAQASPKGKTVHAKNDTKTSRAKYACPDKLAALIEQVGWLAPKETLLAFNDAVRVKQEEMPTADEYEVWQQALAWCLAGQPDELRNYVRTDIMTIGQLQGEIARYEDYRLSRLKLLRLIALRERFGDAYATRAINEDFGGTGLLTVDTDGIIRVVGDSFGGAVNGVLCDRIRRCEYKRCCRVFWASRKDAQACSPNHADILRKEKSRQKQAENWEKSRELYLAARRRKREKKGAD